MIAPVLLVGLWVGGISSSSTDLVARAVSLCREINSRFAELRSISWTAERRSDTGRIKVRERWIFRYAAPDRFRVDYLEPYERVLVIGPDGIWEYLPQKQKALHTVFGSDQEQRKHRIAQALQPVTIPGLRPGDTEAVAAGAVRAAINDQGAIVLECREPRTVLVLDPQHKALWSLEILDQEGRFLLRSQVLAFQELRPGFFFPRKMRIVEQRDGITVTTEVEFSRVVLNTELDPALFQFTPPAETEVINISH